jgi:hypothetical protein
MLLSMTKDDVDFEIGNIHRLFLRADIRLCLTQFYPFPAWFTRIARRMLDILGILGVLPRFVGI